MSDRYKAILLLLTIVTSSWAASAFASNKADLSDYCGGVRLVHGNELQAWCYDSDSVVVPAAVNLAPFIVNNNGLLIVHSSGNFDDSCGNGFISPDFVLQATCVSVSGELYTSSLDLKNYLWLEDGRLRFVP